MDQFEVSRTMSTYLVAFVVCDYRNVSNTTRHNITVSVFAPPTMINQADYALQVASHIFDYYQDFFGVQYPLPKQGVARASCYFCFTQVLCQGKSMYLFFVLLHNHKSQK